MSVFWREKKRRVHFSARLSASNLNGPIYLTLSRIFCVCFFSLANWECSRWGETPISISTTQWLSVYIIQSCKTAFISTRRLLLLLFNKICRTWICLYFILQMGIRSRRATHSCGSCNFICKAFSREQFIIWVVVGAAADGICFSREFRVYGVRLWVFYCAPKKLHWDRSDGVMIFWGGTNTNHNNLRKWWCCCHCARRSS